MTEKIQPGLRLTFEKSERFFGPGVAELMEKIEEEGSIQGACMKMGMSYSKGWKILKRAEKELGFPVLHTHNGGAHGGKSELTCEGKDFLIKYRKMERSLKEQMRTLYSEIFE